MPMLIYIIIKAKPKKMFSNFQFIKALIHPSKQLAGYGFILTQLEVSMEYILKFDHTSVKMNEEEYMNFCRESQIDMGLTTRRKALSKNKKN
jgi:hypothetical protein